MSAVPKQKMTEDEYLAFEEASETKHEFYNGELFDMAGASRQHNDIASNLHGELFTRLKGGPCRVSMADQRVKVKRTGLYTYPDLLIVCGPREFDKLNKNTLLNPNVVIEILSDSTEGYDRGTKFEHYQKLPSVREYVLVRQDRMRVERLVRQPDETWNATAFDDPAGSFTLATIPISIPLADVYRDVELTGERLR
jgi:Uma2 family endonuclease